LLRGGTRWKSRAYGGHVTAPIARGQGRAGGSDLMFCFDTGARAALTYRRLSGRQTAAPESLWKPALVLPRTRLSAPAVASGKVQSIDRCPYAEAKSETDE